MLSNTKCSTVATIKCLLITVIGQQLGRGNKFCWLADYRPVSLCLADCQFSLSLSLSHSLCDNWRPSWRKWMYVWQWLLLLLHSLSNCQCIRDSCMCIHWQTTCSIVRDWDKKRERVRETDRACEKVAYILLSLHYEAAVRKLVWSSS